ncbi:bacterio-opsin activator domain-containing protein, partial [Haloarcula nitratireducens]|nr:hypothetical protein [Halomicroarcula nitratireducens]
MECEIDLERRIPTGDGGYLYYVTVLGAPPAQVCDCLEDGQLVSDSSVVHPTKNGEPALIETHLEETPRLPLDVLTDY